MLEDHPTPIQLYIQLVEARWYKGVGYETRLSDVATDPYCINKTDWSFIWDGAVDFKRPYDLQYSTDNWSYWICDMDFEYCISISSRFVFHG